MNALDIRHALAGHEDEPVRRATLPGTFLTIDRLGVREFLSEVEVYQASVDHMDALCIKSMSKGRRTPTYEALNTARCAVHIELTKMVDSLHRRGGLLLLTKGAKSWL